MNIPRPVLLSARFVVGIAIVLILLSRFDLGDVLQRVREGDPRLYLLSFASFGLSRLSEAVRLYFLVDDRRAPFGRIAEIVFVSTFFNNFALAVVGDAYRVYALRQWAQSVGHAVAMIFVDRVFGLIVVAAMIVVYFLVGRSVFDLMAQLGVDGTVPAWAWISAAGGLLAIGMFGMKFGRRLASRLGDSVAGMGGYLGRVTPAEWTVGVVITVVSQVWMALSVSTLVAALGPSVAFADVVFLMLLIYIAAVVPVSVGSLGVREGILILGLPLFGTTPEIAVSVAVLSRLIMYIYALLGGLWLLFATRRVSPPNDTEVSSK